MPRIDDEVNLGKRKDSLVKVFDFTRKVALIASFDKLWTERFTPGSKAVHSLDSWTEQTGLYLSLEHLRKTGAIPDAPIFTQAGNLVPHAQQHDVEAIFGSEGILKGKRVMVFGGFETDVFRAMGAHAVGFDPVFGDSMPKLEPSVYARRLEELKKLSEGPLNGWADLTYSNDLFEPGSGLVVGEGNRRLYAERLGIVLALTKPGGLSIHNGTGMLPAVLPLHDEGFLINAGPGLKSYSDFVGEINPDVMINNIPSRIIEIVTPTPDSIIHRQDTVYVLQRKAA